MEEVARLRIKVTPPPKPPTPRPKSASASSSRPATPQSSRGRPKSCLPTRQSAAINSITTYPFLLFVCSVFFKIKLTKNKLVIQFQTKCQLLVQYIWILDTVLEDRDGEISGCLISLFCYHHVMIRPIPWYKKMLNKTILNTSSPSLISGYRPSMSIANILNKFLSKWQRTYCKLLLYLKMRLLCKLIDVNSFNSNGAIVENQQKRFAFWCLRSS